MKTTTLTLPELAAIAGTRVALGAGAALLLAGRLSRKQRTAAGWPLFLIGAASTVPLALLVLGRRGKGR
jgi:4-amino-4-deoxy-L-arabinose transferase-like glycosyltransferase